MKNPKIEKAFDAMNALGISRDRVKPVLRRLYKLYDKNWSFIEAENYRALVDAVFEEDKEAETKRKKVKVEDEDVDVDVDVEESQRPLKKLHGVSEEDEASSTVDSSGMQLGLNQSDAPANSLSGGGLETSVSRKVNDRVEIGSSSKMQKRIGQTLSTTRSDSGKLASERASSSSGSKLLVNGSASLPVDLEKVPDQSHGKKPILCDSKQCDIDLTLLSRTTSKSSVLPDLVEGSSTGNISAKSSLCIDLENIKECASATNFQKCECKLDLVSLRSGDVKLCCIAALGKPAYCSPDKEAVLKSVEDKFLKTHKVVGPSFSLKTVLEDICNNFLELTDDKTTTSSKPYSQTHLRSANINRQMELTDDTANKSLVRTPSPEVISQEPAVTETETLKVFQENLKQKAQLFIEDISKGEERVKIPLVNEHGTKDPPKFFYIPKNIIYQKAIVNISLARISDEDCCSSCLGDCLSSPVPCFCTRTTNGEYAYTKDGCLTSTFLSACLSDNKHEVFCQDCPIERAINPKKPEKCKGHAVRKFIKECWSKCGCSMQCGNRVVQRGITRKLQVFWTAEGKGWGLRAMEDLPKGAFVCEYVGEVVTNTELDERNRQHGNVRHTYPVHLDADWNSESILDDDFALCLDATNYGNVARFINHKCGNGNLLDVPVEVETVDHHYYHVAFFTTQEVKAYEELAWDYGIDFEDENHPIKAFRCRCGSPHCRDKGRKGSRSKQKASVR